MQPPQFFHLREFASQIVVLLFEHLAVPTLIIREPVNHSAADDSYDYSDDEQEHDVSFFLFNARNLLIENVLLVLFSIGSVSLEMEVSRNLFAIAKTSKILRNILR